MIEHNKNFYSLEELKRTRDSLEGYLDNEEVYYFVGAIRYACDEIERLNKENKMLKQCLNIVSPSKKMLEGKYWETKEIERLNNIIKKVEECIDYYAIENEDFSKFYNNEEIEILKIIGSDKE